MIELRQLLDAVVGERPRVRAGLDGGVLGRQPEAVEAHRATARRSRCIVRWRTMRSPNV